MGTTNNFHAKKPRQLFLGSFAALEPALARAIADHKQTHGALAPLTVIVPTRLLGLHLQRTLAHVIPAGHANVRFQTLADFQPPTDAPLALELLCRQLATAFPSDGYFAPIRDTPGFAGVLLATFTDLREAGLDRLPGKQPKLRELAAAYEKFLAFTPPSTLHPPLASSLLYGFYDLNAAQKQLVERLAPAAVFFPATPHDAYSQPLLNWFQSLGYTICSSEISNLQSPISVLSTPGEAAEVREAVRVILDYLRDHPGKTFADCAILCRSRDQYDALLRDILPSLGIHAFHRGGRPLTEHPDARLLLLLLEVIRADYSRAAVMELACHCGPHSHWDALTVELGIIGGRQQWQDRLRPDQPLARFISELFAATAAIPARGKWTAFAETTIAAFQRLGGRHEPVNAAIAALAELDAVQSPVDFATFAEFCQKALDAARQQPASFQGGGLFVGDVMGARGLSFDFVVVLGLVEKSFPRLVREDPLLLDDERAGISPDLSLKRRGHDEERLLFDLARAAARDRLVLSFPRLDAGTARPRVPSFLLLEATGTANFKALEALPGFHRVPLSAFTETKSPVDERELDLAALNALADPDDYLAAVSPLVQTGVRTERQRWRERTLTGHDGLIESPAALQLLRDRFGLEKLVISATSLEDFFGCPFYYFQKHVLHIEPWREPEATVVIDPADLGTLYHRILEVFYRNGGDLDAVITEHLRQFEREGVTGYPTVWAIKQEIIRQELTAFVAREQRRLGDHWKPAAFEQSFDGLAVAPPVRLRGKIDRVDISADGRRARVLDYKTGKIPAGLKDDSLAAGEALQLPLYLLAAEQLLPGVTVEEAGYLFFTLRGGYRQISFSRDALTTRRAELTGLLETAAGMIRDGCFAQFATKSNCDRCDFRTICGNGILKLYAGKADDARMTAFREIKETVA